MTELPTIGAPSGVPRTRDAGRLVVEVLVWVVAFSLLLCIPTERPQTARSAERARPAETR